ncbi:CBS domain-containing protein [Streptomyces sp. HPF1205]|uniref:CBS domain-containing protein n=1 Tax=Streptomyces sp. HPF1205 TaxID=2873262 RepID=UPI001CECD6F8|nr:CBS domain-containing protein [Streptomyces sp. HPF1205]
MTRQVREVMSPGAAAVEPMASLTDVARLMREKDIGEVLVAYDCDLFGVITDRDIVVRALGRDLDPAAITAGHLCTHPPLAVVSADDTTDHAAELMREFAIRRIPVVEHGGCPVGMLSLGDLAVLDEPGSALAEISGAPPNH